MKTIHKQVLKVTDEQTLSLPVTGIIRLIAVQNDDICIWYEFDKSDDKNKDVKFRIYGTGHDIDDKDLYLCSVIQGVYVWHIYKSI